MELIQPPDGDKPAKRPRARKSKSADGKPVAGKSSKKKKTNGLPAGPLPGAIPGAGAGRQRLEYVEAGTLTGNPLNWRRHPEGQLRALDKLIHDEEVGWAGALLYNERTGRLIDGHGRLKVVKADEIVPVLIGNWSEAAERTILASHDPLADMAEADADALARLLNETDLTDPSFNDLNDMLNGLIAVDREPVEEDGDDAGGELDEPMYRVIATCDSEQQQQEIYDLLKSRGVEVRLVTQ